MNELLLGLADDELVIGWRDSEWTGIAPLLEEDVAFSSIAQNEIGHARAVYELLAEVRSGAGQAGTSAPGRAPSSQRTLDPDALAFDRPLEEYRCAPLVELRLLDWAHAIARRWLYEEADEIRISALMQDDDPRVAGLAAKINREEAYHRMHAEMWRERLADTPQFQAAVDDLGRDDERAPLGPGGCAMVTAEQIWSAFGEIPDPEIPVVSLVDLGVIRSVDVENGHVRVEFTPTFLGCPALEVMKRALEEKVAGLGAEPEVQVIQDDSWSTDKITPAGREKLRAAGFAPPAPREAGIPKLVQLHAKAFRCPYCNSTQTKLENIFGPTPCRSLRYCESCRQPFEQFKTI